MKSSNCPKTELKHEASIMRRIHVTCKYHCASSPHDSGSVLSPCSLRHSDFRSHLWVLSETCFEGKVLLKRPTKRQHVYLVPLIKQESTYSSFLDKQMTETSVIAACMFTAYRGVCSHL